MNVYQQLGVVPIINASGSMTTLGGSIMPPEVTDAMAAASRHFVDIHQLHRAAGRRIAELIGVEAAHVCAGASAGITLMAAACMAGTDRNKIARLPDTTGMANRFVVHRAHRNPFDHAVQIAGGKFVEISASASELERALDAGAAAVSYVYAWFCAGQALPLGEVARLAHRAGVPVIVDAAGQVPPVDNLSRFLDEGADLVAFSGGKSIRGPQTSGLILGRKDLIEACAMNDCPHIECMGRGMKAGKEEIVGLVKAVELYHAKDHAAEMAVWEGRVAHIAGVLSEVAGVRAERAMPAGIGYLIPYVSVSWDEKELGRTHRGVAQALLEGEPPIAVRLVGVGGDQVAGPQMWLHVHSLQEGEEAIVARRVREILLAKPVGDWLVVPSEKSSQAR
jgi:L-seryl-tRNA(Ser) seleniumtransferase